MCLIILRWGLERTYRVTRRSLFIIEDWIQQILDIVSFVRIRRWRVNVIFVSYPFCAWIGLGARILSLAEGARFIPR